MYYCLFESADYASQIWYFWLIEGKLTFEMEIFKTRFYFQRELLKFCAQKLLEHLSYVEIIAGNHIYYMKKVRC